MLHHPLRRFVVLGSLSLALQLAACDPDEKVLPLCDPTPISCGDNMIQDLSLRDSSAPGGVTNTALADGFETLVDATAGGFNPTHAFVYASFTADGMIKVAIDDETALDSQFWDIAFRRYLIRLNGGDSGPGCVSASLLPAGTSYETATAAGAPPPRTDDSYTDDCTFIDDGSGLGAPALALSGFWSYPGCVKMSGNVYIVTLQDGRKVKLTVSSFYEPSVQAECQSSDTVTSANPGSGNIRLRWAFVE